MVVVVAAVLLLLVLYVAGAAAAVCLWLWFLPFGCDRCLCAVDVVMFSCRRDVLVELSL